ncbi:Phytochrome-like protein cph1 [Acaryochloris thomasi RCC1774]|uniref:histidine kinase n=1 Tax=Acaryochloris thomasi RCC1774 TaxID=1764569 RepID=A0A2W1JP35_9CYAN|nr:hybrid sensor histidine kinase/response regulator [Acaryochloris thomasi]PZD75108.1 Phytochrome-like protein cph1 [Acaryochloris thomasi RCC1774]
MVDQAIQVLLVEDDEDDYLLIRDLLSEVPEQRFQLDWVKTFSEAADQIQRQPYSVYLVDYRLGEQNGLELMALVNQQDAPAPEIILSGQGDRNLDITALKSGAADYLDKADLQASLLEHYIRASIERNRAQLALQESEKRYRDLYQQEKLLRSELARANTELKDFAHTASHDLQEPLRAVSGHISLLQDKLFDDRSVLTQDAEVQEYFGFIAAGTRRMQTLVHDLLVYSRVGTRDLVLKDVDCGESVEDAIANLHIAITEAKAEIIYDDLPHLRADATQMMQLFQNLISNAIKFRHPDTPPHITIQADPIPAAQWRFSITDNGIGIDLEECDRIFKIFKRLHTQQEFAGTGMGLTVCEKIVDRHGGKIWAESQPGAGATFWFILPQNPPERIDPPLPNPPTLDA